VKYEDLVESPLEQSARLLEFAGLEMSPRVEAYIRAEVTRSNLEKWRNRLDDPEKARIRAIAGDVLDELGYAP